MAIPALDSLHVQIADFQRAQEQLEDQVRTEDVHVRGKPTGAFVSSPTIVSVSNKTNLLFASNMTLSNRPSDLSKVPIVAAQERESSAESHAGATQSIGRPSTIKATAVSQGSHASLMRLGPRLRAEGLMVPPASDAATLRCQLTALQTDLEARVDAEQRLQDFNQQLQERLELYMKQNHENLQRAALEMNTLHDDMEQTLELQRRLAERASALERERKELEQALQKHVQNFENERASLQAQVSSLSRELSQHSESRAHAKSLKLELEETLEKNVKLQEKLHQSYVEAKYLKLKAEEYNNNINTITIKEQVSHTVENRFRQAVLRRCFLRLQDGADMQRIVNNTAKAAAAFKNKIYSRQGLQALRKATNRAKYIRLAHINRAKTTLEEYLKAWHFLTTIQKRCEKVVKDKARSCICKAILKWKKVLATGKPDKGKQCQIFGTATKQYNGRLCKRFWKNWLRWVTYSVRPKKLKLADIKRCVITLNCRQTIAAWRCAIRIMQVKRLKYQQALYQQKYWHCRRSILRWRGFLSSRQFRYHLNEKALNFRQLHLWHAVLISWKNFLCSKNYERLSQSLAFRHYLLTLKCKAMTVWRQNIKYQQAQLRALLEFNCALKRAALVFWRDYHIVQAIKKKKERRAMIHEKKREQKILKKFFFRWRELITWKRRATQLEHLLSIWWQRSLLLAALHCWVRGTFKIVVETNLNFQNQLQEAQAHYEEQKNQKTAVGVENLQLTDRLQTLSSEIALLRIHISDRSKREEELHHTLEDGAVVESSMRCELEQRRMHKEDLEKQIVIMQKSFQTKNSEDATGEVHHMLEIQNLEFSLKDLRCKLAQKSSQIESYEKTLKETAERLEGASDESCEKLSSAFEIAASLRKLLEIRESQFAALEERARVKELELGDLQRKLAVGNSAFFNTLESREARIHELEHLVAVRQAEIHEAQLDYQELQVSLDAKEIHLRKLEYELKLNCGVQEPINVKSFIANHNCWPQVNHNDVSSLVRNNWNSGPAMNISKSTYAHAMATACTKPVAEKVLEFERGLQKESPDCQANRETSPSQDDQSTDSLEFKAIEPFLATTKSFRTERCSENDYDKVKPVRERRKTNFSFDFDEAQQPSRDNQNSLFPQVESGNKERESVPIGASKTEISQTTGVAEPCGQLTRNTSIAADLGRPDRSLGKHLLVDNLRVKFEQLQARVLDHLSNASLTLEELQISSPDSRLAGRHIPAFRRKSFTGSTC